MTIMGVLHFSIMTISVYQLYKICFNWLFIKIALVVFGLAIIATFVCMFDNVILKYILGGGLVIVSCTFSLYISKKHFEIDLLKYLYDKF